MTPAEAAATALAPLVREHGWMVERGQCWLDVITLAEARNEKVSCLTIWCADQTEAARLAALLRGA